VDAVDNPDCHLRRQSRQERYLRNKNASGVIPSNKQRGLSQRRWNTNMLFY